ncbi:sporulation related domain protein [bacterium BMS3Bbin04]|nr:sporulation related domain protein [bacterium BMS3Bbin04]
MLIITIKLTLANKIIALHYCTMRSSLFILLLLVALMSCIHAQAEHPIVRWALAGQLDSLAHAANQLTSTPEGRLAGALANDDAAVAIPTFKRLVEDESLSDDLLALAWQRLHGYAVIVGDNQLSNEAAIWLNDHPDVSERLFHGNLPIPRQTRFWAVQIGAFSNRSNADRLAAEQRSNGYTVQIDQLQVNGQTLHAVRVGRFDSHTEADDFARRVFGEGGYRVVEIVL